MAHTEKLGLVWSGPLFGDSGYAEEARALINVLRESNIRSYARNIGIEESTEYGRRLTEFQRSPLARNPVPPFVDVAHYYRPDFHHLSSASYRVWRTMFETDSLPQSWVSKANQMDEVWVPSEFNQATFARAGVDASKVHVLRQAIDFSKWTSDGSRMRLYGDDHFVFLSIFRWQQRKGWDILLDAFFDEFNPKEKVVLVIKTAPFHVPENGFEERSSSVSRELNGWLAFNNRDPKSSPTIRLLEDWHPSDALPALYRGADCFVLPSRGEGWGRPYMEAMSVGLPTIGTRWGGNLEFMNDTNSILIDSNIVPVDSRASSEWSLFESAMTWAEPKRANLRQAMRRAYEDRPWSRRLGQEAGQSIRRRFNSQRIAEELSAAIRRIERSPGS